MAMLLSILLDGSIYGFVALGIVCTVFWARAADLTPDASFVSGAVSAWLGVMLGFSGFALIGFGALGGALAGFATFVVIRCRIQPLLASLIVVGTAYSVHWSILGRPLQSIPVESSWFFLDNEVANAAQAVALLVGIAGLLLWSSRTKVGLLLRAAGENSNAVPNGFRWSQTASFTFLIVGNGLVGIGGALFASRAFFVEINMGVGMMISGLSAVLLGWSITGFKPRATYLVLGACFGAIALRAIVSEALVLGMSAQWFRALAAGALLICLLLSGSRGSGPLRGVRL